MTASNIIGALLFQKSPSIGTGIPIGIGALEGIHGAHIGDIPGFDESRRVLCVVFYGNDFIILYTDGDKFFPAVRIFRHFRGVITVLKGVSALASRKEKADYQANSYDGKKNKFFP